MGREPGAGPAERRSGGAGLAGPEPPFRAWLRHARFAGVRLGTLLGTALVLYLCFPVTGGSEVPVLERGTVAPEDVVARVGFTVPKAPEVLQREREQAASGVPVVLRLNPAAVDSSAAQVEAFFAGLEAELGVPGAVADAAIRRALARAGVPLSLGTVEALRDSAVRAQLHAVTVEELRRVHAGGVAPAGVGDGGARMVQLLIPGAPPRLVSTDSLHTLQDVYDAAAARLPPEVRVYAAELQRLLLVRHFHPSLVVDQAETAAARDRARAAVDPIATHVVRGEKIVGAHEQVGPREEARLRAYQAALDRERGAEHGHAFGRVVGALLFNVLLLSIVGFMLRLARHRLYRDDRSVVFTGFLVVSVAGLAAAVSRAELPPELIPVPFAAMLAAILWGGRLALTLALVLALLLGGQAPFLGVAVPFTAAVGGAAAAFGVRLAQRRLQTWVVVGVISAAYAACAVAIGLMRAQSPEEVGWAALWGMVNATASTLLAVGFLPVAEWFTRVTTQQTLMELADPRHPLLRRLAMEAPGTYAHTIAVANLAEAACHAIGADALLARVGVYYHDVGKVAKPHYFIENQPPGRNPHDKLKPATSAAIVRSHVGEGLRLAQEHRLPPAVRAFITQHHGTQTISFFLEQARSADPAARLNPADFQYHGPRPQTRETAVVMLADSVESAARVLADPTAERVRELVERIVAGKLAKGQLDQCPLTLHDLHAVKVVLARVLSGMYHQRVDYPPAPAEAPAAAPPAGGAPADAPPAGPTRAAG